MKIFITAFKKIFVGIKKKHKKYINSDVLPYGAYLMGPFLSLFFSMQLCNVFKNAMKTSPTGILVLVKLQSQA